MEALESRVIVVGDWREPAIPEFGFYFRGIPRLDHETEVHHARGLLFRRSPKNRRAPIADIQYRLLAAVAALGPAHQRDIERSLFPIIRHLKRDVIQRYRLPSGGR